MARPYVDGETLAEGLKVGTDKDGNKVVKVASGWKVCPACKRPVKGPRTAICTHANCKAVIGKVKDVVAKPAKVKAKVDVSTPEPVADIVKFPDPYTFTEISTPDFTPGVVP